MEHHGITKLRKNGVLAMDTLITLSPDVFRNGDENNEIDPELVERFVQGATEWLDQRFYKGRVISMVLHMDESNPHIHATVLPLDKNRKGKMGLNARKMFTSTTLSDMQRDYYAHMQKLFPGLRSPKHGSKATHKKIRHHYEELNRDKDELRKRQLQLYELELEEARKSEIRKFLEKWIPGMTSNVERLSELRELVATMHQALLSKVDKLVSEHHQDIGAVEEFAGEDADFEDKLKMTALKNDLEGMMTSPPAKDDGKPGKP